jgi:hypothetical protein
MTAGIEGDTLFFFCKRKRFSDRDSTAALRKEKDSASTGGSRWRY